MAGETEKYLDMHPFRIWDQDQWEERSAILDTRFHATDVIFTPLVGHTLTMPPGIGWDQYWYQGGEMYKAHANQNTIGRYQRYLTPIYIDTRQRRLRARYHYAAKTQLEMSSCLIQ